ncbi:MAG: hypothetical protein KGI71_04735 [Patescibacteria group bacterium]|nr:hypothetical protein [Patescibacteria group bacterium]
MSYAAAVIGAGAGNGPVATLNPCDEFTLVLDITNVPAKYSPQQWAGFFNIPAAIVTGPSFKLSTSGNQATLTNVYPPGAKPYAVPQQYLINSVINPLVPVVSATVTGKSKTGVCGIVLNPGGKVGGKVGGTASTLSSYSGWSTKKKVAVIGGSVLALGLVAGGVWWVVR